MFSYKVGLDFGTAYSVVSYYSGSDFGAIQSEPHSEFATANTLLSEVQTEIGDEVEKCTSCKREPLYENEQLYIFEYDACRKKHVPSCITYDDGIVIGQAACDEIVRKLSVEGYKHFKKQLLLDVLKYLSRDEEQCNSMNVTADFLRELLLSKTANSSSFTQQKGNIGSLVISIPETYYRDIASLGKSRLEHLIISQLGLEQKCFQLVSESVAAATYWLWEKRCHNLEHYGNLLICDMGSSTFKLSLCNISVTNKVKVLYSDCQEEAGFAFDRYCVQLAYTQKHGYSLTEENSEFLRLLRDFELEKINSHEKSTSRLTTYQKAPEAMAEYNLYCFGGGYAVKCRHVSEAFVLIQQRIQEVFQRLHTWMKSHQQSFNFLFLIGGFCQFIFTQNAILQALDIPENDPRFDISFNNAYSPFAISYGTCLIASSLVDPIEKCAYTIGIVVETLNTNAEREQQLVAIIQRGTNLDDLLNPQFIDKPLLTSFTEHLSTITLWVDADIKASAFKEVKLDAIELPNYSCENHWRVGMRVSHSHIWYLVIQDCKDKQSLEYELGILADIVTPLH